MELSYVIPLYNAESYIEQCIQSVINQNLSKKDYEIIIINDGSKDNSLSKVNTFVKEHTNISVYNQENKGVSATRNRGIDLAKGKYIWFIDADDYIISNTAAELLNFAQKHNLDILEFNRIRTASRALNKTMSTDFDSSEIPIVTGKEYASNVGLNDSCCSNLYKREFIIATGVRFIEGRIMEDMTFNAEIFPKSNKIARYPLDSYRYVINPNSIWTNKESKAYRKSIRDFVFMTKKFSLFIEEYKDNGIDTRIIIQKQQEMLFNISKRLLMSDFELTEIRNIIKDLSSHKLYPLKSYRGKSLILKTHISIFNRLYLFLPTVLMYRLFKKPIKYFVIKNHQAKREKLIKETVVELQVVEEEKKELSLS